MTNADLPGLPLPLSGETRLYTIIGDTIDQVGSPGLFNAAFRRRGAKAVGPCRATGSGEGDVGVPRHPQFRRHHCHSAA